MPEIRTTGIDQAGLGWKAMALDERLPLNYSLFGAIHLVKWEYEQTIGFMEAAVTLAPNDANRKTLLAFTLTYTGKPAAAETILGLNPSFSTAEFAKSLPYRDPAELDRVVAAMRLAGLPECRLGVKGLNRSRGSSWR